MRRRSRAFVEQSFKRAGRAGKEEGFDSGGHITLLQQKHNFHHGDTEARRRLGLFGTLPDDPNRCNGIMRFSFTGRAIWVRRCRAG
jgi:hypothetical protein